jgi:hypothetical protein
VAQIALLQLLAVPHFPDVPRLIAYIQKYKIHLQKLKNIIPQQPFCIILKTNTLLKNYFS